MGKTLLVVLAVQALAACAVDTSGDGAAVADESSVVTGPLDWTHPAVGQLGACSATLVAPDAVLTSAGCDGQEFAVRDEHGVVEGRYAVTGTSRVGDLAIARLSTAVPAAVATPVDLANTLPGEGARVMVLGFGCTGQGLEDARKRSASIRWTNAPGSTCPGTLVIDLDGRAVAVGAAEVPPAADAIREALR
jgi:hypothetical protein